MINLILAAQVSIQQIDLMKVDSIVPIATQVKSDKDGHRGSGRKDESGKEE